MSWLYEWRFLLTDGDDSMKTSLRDSFASRLENRVNSSNNHLPALGLPRVPSWISHAGRTEAGFLFTMSVRQSSLVWQQSKSKNAARLVALAIADFADDSGHAYPSVHTLSKKSALSTRATQAAIRKLETLGELHISANAGPHGTNLYLLTVEPGAKLEQAAFLPPADYAPANSAPRRIIQGGVQILRERGADSASKPSVEPSRTVNGTARAGRNSNRVPTTEQSRRVATIFHRKLTTPWSRNEVRAYKDLETIPEEDLAAVERYYAANWPPCRDKNILRHDLITFLNNFQGEVDRAHASKTGTRDKPEPLKEHSRWRAFLKARDLSYESELTALQYVKEEFQKWLMC